MFPLFKKATALLTVITFISTQVTWANPQTIDPALNSNTLTISPFQFEEGASDVLPESSLSDFLSGDSNPLSEVAAEELNPIEILEEHRVGLNWRAHFNEGEVIAVQNSEGLLRDVVIDETTSLLSGTFVDTQNDAWTITDGNISQIEKESGEIYFYGSGETEGFVERILNTDGSEIFFNYTFDESGEVETIQKVDEGPFEMPESEILEEQYSDGSSQIEFGSNLGVSVYYQEIEFDDVQAIESVEFWMQKYGNPTGDVLVRVYEADASGNPGSLIQESEARHTDSFTSATSTAHSASQWESFSFAEAFELEANTKYFLAVEFGDNYSSFGSGSDVFRLYLNENVDPYSAGRFARLINNNLQFLSGDLDFKVNGYEGGLPGPPRYEVSSGGQLFLDGEQVTEPIVPSSTGFTRKRNLPAVIESLKTSYLGLESVQVNLVSSASVETRDYSLEIDLEGVLFESSYNLEAGVNTLQGIFDDGLGNALTFSWDVFSDTFPPEVSLVSDDVSHTSETTLTYLVDGETVEETVYLKAGRNIITKTFSNEWGNTFSEYIIDYQPVLEDGSVLKYQNGALQQIEKNGLIFENMVLSETGELVSGSVLLPNAVRIEIENGDVEEIHSPDGSLKNFDLGLIQENLPFTDTDLFYTHTFDSNQNVEALEIQVGDEPAVVNPDILVEQMSAGSDQMEFGSNSNVSVFYQEVEFDDVTAISSVDFWMQKWGNPQGDVLVKVYSADSAGDPGTLIHTSEPRHTDSFSSASSTAHSSADWENFHFTAPFELAADTKYFLALEFGDNYQSFGSGSDVFRVYRNESGDPYTGGRMARVIGGGLQYLSGDLDFKVNGFEGGIPGPEILTFDVATNGDLLDENGAVVTSPYVPHQEGYTQATTLNAEIQYEGFDASDLMAHISNYFEPSDPPAATLVSEQLVTDENYVLRYDVGGVVHEESHTLSEGENTLRITAQDDLGQTTIVDFVVELDTTAPLMQLASTTEAHSEAYELRYTVDGVLRTEILELTEGDNAFTREALDAAGNLSQLTFTITYTPFFQNTNAVYDSNGYLTAIQDPSTGLSLHYESDAPHGITVRDALGEVITTIEASLEPQVFEDAVEMTLDTGIQAFYVEDELVQITTADNTLLQNIETDPDGNILSATLFYPNGSVDVLSFGKRVRHISEGVITDFDFDDQPVREMTADDVFHFVYVHDTNGDVETVIRESEAGTVEEYTADGILKRTDDGAGNFSELENGKLKKTVKATGEVYEYDLTSGDSVLDTALSSTPMDETPVLMEYDSEGLVEKVVLETGQTIEYTQGVLTRVLDADGNESTYSAEFSEDVLAGLQVVREGTTFHYDSTGFLNSIETDEGVLTRSVSAQGDETVDLLLETVSGHTLTDFELDQNGNILNAVIETAEGVRQRIENGVLVEMETVDGKLYDISNNQAQLSEWNFKDGTRVTFGSGTIDEILFADGRRLHTIGLGAEQQVETFVEELADGTLKEYENNKLVKLTTPEGVEITYNANSLAEEIIFSENDRETVSYKKTSGGDIAEIMFDGEYTSRTFSAEGDILRLLNAGVNAVFENNAVKELSTRFGEIENPDFSELGILSGEVSLVDGTRLYLHEGNLRQITLASGDQIFYEDGEIIQTITNGEVFEFIHAEDGSIQIRYDDNGIMMTEDLIPYLLQNPESSFTSIFMPKSLENTLTLNPTAHVSSAAGEEGAIRLAFFEDDAERGRTFSLNDAFLPEVAITEGTGLYDSAEIGKLHWLFENEDVAPLISGMRDMNGDGLPDRVYLDASRDFWWVEYFNGLDFLNPVEWHGILEDVETDFHNDYEGLTHYEGSHPVQLGTLIDMNGDGLEDRVLSKSQNVGDWHVHLNNGNGFDAAVIWDGDIQPASPVGLSSVQITNAIRVRDEINRSGSGPQPLIADLIDMNGDGLPDRVVRPRPDAVENLDYELDHWFVQMNNGTGFEQTQLWKGVDNTFDTDEAIGLSLSWYHRDGNVISNVADLVDMNGDGLLDRVLTKDKTSDPLDGQTWYVQLSTGEGFEEATLWDDTLRFASGNFDATAATGIHTFNNSAATREVYADLVDVTGDGLPDRVTVDAYDAAGTSSSWWVEANNGAGFDSAVEWTGIYGNNEAQAAIGYDSETVYAFVSGDNNMGWPSQISGVTELRDMNDDGILDRVIYPAGEGKWLIQYGTGSGYLPAEELTIEALSTSAETIETVTYDSLHISLQSENGFSAVDGSVEVLLSGEGGTHTFTIDTLTTDWQNFTYALEAIPFEVDNVEVKWVPATGATHNPGKISVDNITFFAKRPPAAKEWLDYLLTEENILSEIHSDRTETLESYLGLTEADLASDFDWQVLLEAETRIEFTEEGEVEEFEKLYGSVTTISENTEGATVSTTVLPDGSVVEFEAPLENEAANTLTQTVTNSEGISETMEISYGRVRKINRAEGSPLEYRYEFDSLGREITVVYDPDTEVTEKYRAFEAPSGEVQKIMTRILANGVETHFEYNENAELIGSTIGYKGRVRETFQHGVTDEGESTLTTESGVTEIYDAEGKILFHITPEGYRYTHSFGSAKEVQVTYETEQLCEVNGEFTEDCAGVSAEDILFEVDVPVVTLEDCITDCEDVHRVELTHFKNGDESATYEKGTLKTMTLDDGTVIAYDTSEAALNASSDVYSGSATVFHTDGTITEFVNGSPSKVISATGRVIDISLNILSLEGEGLGEGGKRTSLNNKTLAAEFHHIQAVKLWDETVSPKWTAYQLATNIESETEYSLEGQLITRRYAQGSLEIFDDAGKIDQVIASDGALYVDYHYDAEGNIIDIDMLGSRRHIDSTLIELRTQIALERERALSDVAEREQVISETTEGEYLVQRDRLLFIKEQILDQQAQIASISVKGKSGRAQIATAMGQIQVGLDQVNQALENLAEQRNDALESLATQVQDLNLQIETETTQAYADISAEEVIVKDSILEQETSPVVYHWYRHILGRDPSKAEYDAEIATLDYENSMLDLSALKNRLETSTELSERTTEVNAIRSAVRTELEAYLLLSDAEKETYADGLGVLAQTVDLSESEVQAVLTYLDNQSLHFGQSAFLSLEALLADAGVVKCPETNPNCHPDYDPGHPELVSGSSFTRVQLAKDLIITDILTGTLTPLERSDLIISMYAMQKYAARFGLEVSPMKLSYEALKSLFLESSESVVAHVDGNHYIIVTGFSETTDTETGEVIEEIHYLDPGAGPEDNLDPVTMSKEDFIDTWKNEEARISGTETDADLSFGYVLTPRGPPASHPENEQSEYEGSHYQILTEEESMEVRGAFFGLIALAVTLVVQAIVATVTAVVTAIGAIIGGLVSAIGSAFTAIGSFFSGLSFSSIGTALTSAFNGLVAGFKAVGGFLFKAFTYLPTQIVSFTGFKAGGAVAKFLTFALSGLQLTGVTSTLDAIGLSPKITGTIMGAGKVIGGAALLFVPGGQALGISLLGSGSTELLGLHTSISPQVLQFANTGFQALSLFTGGFQGQAVEGSSGWLAGLKQAVPYLAGEFATAGMTALGSELGWDRRLTALLRVGAKAVFRGAKQWGQEKGTFLEGVEEGLRSGAGNAVRWGVSLGLEELGAPAALQSFLPGMLGGIAKGYAGGGSGSSSSNTAAQIGQSIFNKIWDTAKRFGGAIAEGVQNVVSFADKVVEGVGSVTKAGFAKAVDFFSGMFDRKTVENMHETSGGDLEGYISANSVLSGDTVSVNFNGEQITWNQETNKLEVFDELEGLSVTNAVKDKQSDIFGGGYVITEEISDDMVLRQTSGVEGEQILLEVNGEDVMRFENIDNDIIFNRQGGLENGRITNMVEGYQIDYRKGEVAQFDHSGFELLAGDKVLSDISFSFNKEDGVNFDLLPNKANISDLMTSMASTGAMELGVLAASETFEQFKGTWEQLKNGGLSLAATNPTSLPLTIDPYVQTAAFVRASTSDNALIKKMMKPFMGNSSASAGFAVTSDQKVQFDVTGTETLVDGILSASGTRRYELNGREGFGLTEQHLAGFDAFPLTLPINGLATAKVVPMQARGKVGGGVSGGSTILVNVGVTSFGVRIRVNEERYNRIKDYFEQLNG